MSATKPNVRLELTQNTSMETQTHTHKHTEIETHLNGSNGNILLDIDGLNVFQTTYKQLHIDVL